MNLTWPTLWWTASPQTIHHTVLTATRKNPAEINDANKKSACLLLQVQFRKRVNTPSSSARTLNICIRGPEGGRLCRDTDHHIVDSCCAVSSCWTGNRKSSGAFTVTMRSFCVRTPGVLLSWLVLLSVSSKYLVKGWHFRWKLNFSS